MQKKEVKSGEVLLETYIKQIKMFPLLTFEEELELSKQIQGGSLEAQHKMVNSNLRLVVKIAGLFSVSNIPLLDLIQEGNIGLIYAAQKFDFRKNVRFCTYASLWIRQFISRFISNRRRMVRLPQRKEEIVKKIQHAYHVLCQSLMHQPGSKDIAKELGITVQEVDAYINMASDLVCLDQSINEENDSAMDIQEDYTYSPERNLLKQASRDGTQRIVNKLMERERHILNYRYQLNGCERHTLRQIGDKFNISPETVRQIERRALRKMRRHADELRECLYVEAI